MGSRAHVGGWGLAVLVLVVLLGACDSAPTRPERTTHTERVIVAADVSPAGVTTLQSTVGFDIRQGGSVAVRAPVLATASNITVDGGLRSGGVTGGRLDERARASQSTVAFQLDGAVERYADVAVITIPVWSSPEDAGRGDPPISIEGSIELPGAPLEVYWHGAPVNAFEVEGAVVQLRGEVTSRRDSDVVVILPADSFPEVPVLPGGDRRDYLVERQEALRDGDDTLASDLKNEARDEDRIAVAYWALVGAEVALPFVAAGPRLLRNAARRRKAVESVPPRLFDPPADLSPAVVALLGRDGHDVGHEATAATILGLADRGVVTLEGPTSDRYRLKIVTGARSAAGAKTPGEEAVLNAIAEAHGADGLEGPPLPLDPEGPWWTELRRDTLRQAKKGGLVQRRYPSGAFMTAVVLLTVTTIPLWARTPEAAVGGVVVAGILCMLPFIGGYVLSPAGHRARAQWEAFGRRAAESSEIESASAPAITMWGPYLVYGAALRIAPVAVKDLSPAGAPAQAATSEGEE